jgi:intracellular septation protein
VTAPAAKKQTARALLIGGLLPLVVYVLIEEYFGTLWGLVAGMIFGLGELAWERIKQGKISPITWVGNGMILFLGGISLITQEGIWFKLQPAILEGVMAIGLWGAAFWKREDGAPVLLALARQHALWQNIRPEMKAFMARAYRGMTLRLGVFFAAHAALATWAAFRASTELWVFLKGIGVPVTGLLYMVVEGLLLRYRITKFLKN